MKKFQLSYEASPADDPIRVSPLSIHAHENTDSDQIFIFVHGLNGERYKTWGDLPRSLFDRFKAVDFGFYGYCNGLARWNPTKSISIEDEAQVLIDTLRDSRYRKIALMGHSLGGVLIRVAVCKMVESNQTALLLKLKVIFLFAVPQQGAHSFPSLVSLVNSDAAALARNSSLVKRTTRVFLDHFHTDEDMPTHKKEFWLPVYCVQAAEDFWVQELSSALNIRSHMRKVVRETHTGLVKGKTDEVGSWVGEKLVRFFSSTASSNPSKKQMIRHGPQSLI